MCADGEYIDIEDLLAIFDKKFSKLSDNTEIYIQIYSDCPGSAAMYYRLYYYLLKEMKELDDKIFWIKFYSSCNYNENSYCT